MVQVLGVVGQSVNLKNPQTGNNKVLPLKNLDENSLVGIIVDLGKRQSPTPGAESEQGSARSPVLVRYKSGGSEHGPGPWGRGSISEPQKSANR